MRQRDPGPEGGRRGEPPGRRRARLRGSSAHNVAEVKPDNIAGAGRRPGGCGSTRKRARTPGVMAPSHELRREINGHIRERLAREGRIHGACNGNGAGWSRRAIPTRKRRSPATTRRATWWRSHRPYTRIGVEKGDERRVDGRRSQGPRGPARRRRGLDRRMEAGRDRRGAGAAARSTAARTSSCARATASAGPATMPASGSSTAAPPRCSPWATAR